MMDHSLVTTSNELAGFRVVRHFARYYRAFAQCRWQYRRGISADRGRQHLYLERNANLLPSNIARLSSSGALLSLFYERFYKGQRMNLPHT